MSWARHRRGQGHRAPIGVCMDRTPPTRRPRGAAIPYAVGLRPQRGGPVAQPVSHSETGATATRAAAQREEGLVDRRAVQEGRISSSSSSRALLAPQESAVLHARPQSVRRRPPTPALERSGRTCCMRVASGTTRFTTAPHNTTVACYHGLAHRLTSWHCASSCRGVEPSTTHIQLGERKSVGACIHVRYMVAW